MSGQPEANLSPEGGNISRYGLLEIDPSNILTVPTEGGTPLFKTMSYVEPAEGYAAKGGLKHFHGLLMPQGQLNTGRVLGLFNAMHEQLSLLDSLAGGDDYQLHITERFDEASFGDIDKIKAVRAIGAFNNEPRFGYQVAYLSNPENPGARLLLSVLAFNGVALAGTAIFKVPNLERAEASMQRHLDSLFAKSK